MEEFKGKGCVVPTGVVLGNRKTRINSEIAKKDRRSHGELVSDKDMVEALVVRQRDLVKDRKFGKGK